jgi:hypothetical protein
MLIRTANGWRLLILPPEPHLEPVPWPTWLGPWSDDPGRSPMADKPGWSRSDMLRDRAAWEQAQRDLLTAHRLNCLGETHERLQEPTGVVYGPDYWAGATVNRRRK